MGKYNRGAYRQVRAKPWKVHPIWRGLGCVFMVLIPIMSCAAGRLFQQMNFQKGWFAVPANLAQSVNPTVSISTFFYNLAARAPELNFLVGIGNKIPQTGEIFYLELAAAVLFMVIGFGLMTVLYSVMYSTIGPSRYGPLDSPPVKKSPAHKAR